LSACSSKVFKASAANIKKLQLKNTKDNVKEICIVIYLYSKSGCGEVESWQKERNFSLSEEAL
jgi:hypothetical protein